MKSYRQSESPYRPIKSITKFESPVWAGFPYRHPKIAEFPYGNPIWRLYRDNCSLYGDHSFSVYGQTGNR